MSAKTQRWFNQNVLFCAKSRKANRNVAGQGDATTSTVQQLALDTPKLRLRAEA
jgi:hypothetical protein